MSTKSTNIRLSTQELATVCLWVNQFPLSKPVKNFHRDMSDGVLVAEILKQLYPNLVELHNYPKCNSTQNKLTNWQTLNRKVLRRIEICLDEQMMFDLACGKNELVEVLLFELMSKHELESYRYLHRAEPATNDLQDGD